MVTQPTTAVRDLFLEDLGLSLDHWIATGTKALTKPDADLRWTGSPESFTELRKALSAAGVSSRHVEAVLRECLVGLLHSVVVGIDGGTQLSEKVRIRLVDDSQKDLSKDLAMDLMGHLLATGRVPRIPMPDDR